MKTSLCVLDFVDGGTDQGFRNLCGDRMLWRRCVGACVGASKLFDSVSLGNGTLSVFLVIPGKPGLYQGVSTPALRNRRVL